MPRQRKILAKRMADESIVGQDAPQIGMTVEHDPEQVKGLTLVPIGVRPDAGQGINHWKVGISSRYLQTKSLIIGYRQQVTNHSKTRQLASSLGIALVIQTTKIDQLLKAQFWRIAQQYSRLKPMLRRDLNGQFAEHLLTGNKPPTKRVTQHLIEVIQT